jgi:hypothetical protein
VGLAGQAQRHRRELLDQQHAGPGVRDTADDRDQAADHDRRQAQRQLVDQQVTGRADQGLGQHDHLLLTAGQGAGQGGEPPLELREQVEDPVKAGHLLGPRQGVAGHAQVVLDGQVGEQPAAFGDDGHARPADPLRPPARLVGAVQEHRA